MIRSFAVALVTIVVVVLVGAGSAITAEQGAKSATGPSSLPIQFTNGTEGVNLEIFVNAGKVADVTVNASGQAASVLDLSNLGKVQVQVYVDVCQDGKTVRVLVVAGQPMPEGNCKRRMVGAAWWSDCGVTRITIDLTKFGMRVIGCGSFFSENKQWVIPVGAGLVAVPFFAGGGGDSTMVSTPITTTVSTTTTTTTTTTNPAPMQPTVPAPAFNYSLNMSTFGVVHTNPGVSSDLCFVFATDPPQANQPFSGTATGPAVQQPSITGTTNSAGRGSGQFRITAFGPYNMTITMTVQNVTKIATAAYNVTSAAAPCQ